MNLETVKLHSFQHIGPVLGWKPASHSSPLHEILILVQGTLHTTLGEMQLVVRAGDILFCPARVTHGEQSASTEMIEAFSITFHWGVDTSSIPLKSHDAGARLRQQCAWLSSEGSARLEYPFVVEKALLQLVLASMLCATGHEGSALVAGVRHFMRAHLDASLTLDMLAKHANLSKYHFERKYKRLTGSTPMSDLRRMRLDFARELIATTDLPLKKIAPQSGLGDEYNLSRLFRRYMGVSPSDLRSKPSEGMVFLVGDAGKCATESFGNRQVVRHGDLSYLVYSNCWGKWGVLVRTFDHRSATFSNPVEIAYGTNEWTLPAMVRDSRGFLHVVVGGDGPLSYIRTLKPDDIYGWTKPVEIARGTYPSIVIDHDDCIYLVYISNEDTEVLLKKKPLDSQWTDAACFCRSDEGKVYCFAIAKGTGPESRTIHVVGHFYYEGRVPGKRTWPEVEGHRKGYRVRPWYLVSKDGGNTWQKSNGTRHALPFTEHSVDILFDAGKPYDIPWSVDIAVDSRNRPHVVYTRSGRTTYEKLLLQESTLVHATWNGKRWVSTAARFAPLQGKHFSHATLAIVDDVLHVALSTASLHCRVALPENEKPTPVLWHLWSEDGQSWDGRKIMELPRGKGINDPKWKLPDGTGDLELLWTTWLDDTLPEVPLEGWTLYYEVQPAKGLSQGRE